MITKNKTGDYRLQITGVQSSNNNSRKAVNSEGFSLIEVVIGMYLVAIALLGLAQLFTLSVMNNTRSDKMTNATFLAQQEIDFIRNLTAEEISSLASSPIDEDIDINNDGTINFRRITQVQGSGSYWNVRVQVFSAAQADVDVYELIQNPGPYHVRADLSTIISR